MQRHGVVWILGAGFSKPLGAPLLGELMTERSAERIAAAYSGVLPATTLEDVRTNAKLYQAGAVEKEWENAEEFLERLDLALENKTARDVFLDWCANSVALRRAGFDPSSFDAAGIPIYRSVALQTLAAEVCLFLRDADPRMERWSPFRAWMDSLTTDDTIITFNYDRVVEMAGEGSSLWVPTPSELKYRDPNAPSPHGPLVLKLHGSVDWDLNSTNGGIGRATRSDGGPDHEGAVTLDASRLAIATPGPTKFKMTQGGLLTSLWNEARRAIEAATAIVFVGYRMPATDSYTKQWLIGVLRARLQAGVPNLVTGGATLPVHTVLGPNVNGADSQRLRGLLRVTHSNIVLSQWPMGAEDFLGLVGRTDLQRPIARIFD